MIGDGWIMKIWKWSARNAGLYLFLSENESFIGIHTLMHLNGIFFVYLMMKPFVDYT